LTSVTSLPEFSRPGGDWHDKADRNGYQNAIKSARHLFMHGDAFVGTLINARRATVTCNGVYLVGIVSVVNGVETANSFTVPAGSAGALVNHGNLPAAEVLLFQQMGLKNQFKIRSIHICVCKNDLVSQSILRCQMSKSRRYTGFAGATFTTENDKLLHLHTDRSLLCFTF
jgi:hypothetical protein